MSARYYVAALAVAIMFAVCVAAYVIGVMA